MTSRYDLRIESASWAEEYPPSACLYSVSAMLESPVALTRYAIANNMLPCYDTPYRMLCISVAGFLGVLRISGATHCAACSAILLAICRLFIQ